MRTAFAERFVRRSYSAEEHDWMSSGEEIEDLIAINGANGLSSM